MTAGAGTTGASTMASALRRPLLGVRRRALAVVEEAPPMTEE